MDAPEAAPKPKVILPPGQRDNSPEAQRRRWIALGGWVALAAVCLFLLYKAFSFTAPVTYAAPKIEGFVASGTRGDAGSWHVLLTWSTSNADEVTIAPDIGKVEVEGRRTLQITKDTTFVMTAKGRGGEATHELEVKVTEP